MVSTLYLIRHGETEDMHPKRYNGHIDVPLSKKGIEQIKRLAKYMNKSYMFHKTYSAIYCSDLSRAVKSAEIIAELYDLKPVIMPELRERNFGIWEGMTFEEIIKKHPAEFEAWRNNPLKHAPVGGENTIEVRDSIVRALDKILGNHIQQNTAPLIHPSPPRVEGKGGSESLSSGFWSLSSETIVIVSHGGVNRVILCHLLGIPLENIFRIEQNYGCLNIIELWDKYQVVKLLNGGVFGR